MRSKSQTKRPIQLEQWIEIMIEKNRTVSTYYPSNEEVAQILRKMNPKPDLIYRRLNFVDGVPVEYNWTSPSPTFKQFGGMWVQRLLPQEWPHLMKRERKSNGHALGARYPQPRPEAWGPCPCPECTKEREETPGVSRYDKYQEPKRDDNGEIIWS